ncbi:class F sortase [Streptomyces sp. Rer75]|uniref:class F sortase n=1 Tax=Streptomyces sp. Rer75 TaxID=2750011 RepID=UPI00211EA23C|nr:class F sortase [Streptomyces sp. Rer75]
MGTQGGTDSNTRTLRWAAAASLIGVFLIYNSVDASSQSSSVAPASPAATASEADSQPETAEVPPEGSDSQEPAAKPASRPGPALPRSTPNQLDIPSLGVSAPFTALSLDRQGTLIPPPDTDNNLVGWYKAGPSPGERGNAIVAGHVDTKTGPAVFSMLNTLKAGSKVTVTRDDGILATFVVDKVQTYKKKDFPDQQVYGDTNDAQLRVITCGGAYDHTAKDYTANVVAFAHLSSFRWA